MQLNGGNFGGWTVDGDEAIAGRAPAALGQTITIGEGDDAYSVSCIVVTDESGARWAYRDTDGVFVGMA